MSMDAQNESNENLQTINKEKVNLAIDQIIENELVEGDMLVLLKMYYGKTGKIYSKNDIKKELGYSAKKLNDEIRKLEKIVFNLIKRMV